jgi:hypothetical protein
VSVGVWLRVMRSTEQDAWCLVWLSLRLSACMRAIVWQPFAHVYVASAPAVTH